MDPRNPGGQRKVGEGIHARLVDAVIRSEGRSISWLAQQVHVSVGSIYRYLREIPRPMPGVVAAQLLNAMGYSYESEGRAVPKDMGVAWGEEPITVEP